MRAVHAALVTGQHPCVLLIGTSRDCGLTTSLGNFLSPDLAERQLRSPYDLTWLTIHGSEWL